MRVSRARASVDVPSEMHLMRGRRLALLALFAVFQGGAALTIAPVPARSAAPRSATIVGQVIDAPVKIPDKVPAFLSSTPDQQKKNDKAKKYKLLLFNDNVNKREYVAKVLTTTIPDFSQADAYVVMQKAHQSGMAVVGVWVFELAEAYCDGLKARALIGMLIGLNLMGLIGATLGLLLSLPFSALLLMGCCRTQTPLSNDSRRNMFPT